MNSSVPRHSMHLAVVASGYPAPARPTAGVFVREFVHAAARQGARCTVIHPVAFHRAWRNGAYPLRSREEVAGGGAVDVRRPRFVSLSARERFRCLGPLNPSLFTYRSFLGAVRRVLRELDPAPDALYGHFLYFSGAAVVRLGQEMGWPAFPCMGEGEIWTVRRFGLERARADLAGATGFLANSSALREILVQDLGVAAEKIGVFPNGADLEKFVPHDRAAARRRFGLPPDRFLVAAVGNFLEKKGIARVGEALAGLEGVAGVFAGSGPVPPEGPQVALCRRVPHAELPELLSACDVFALPTLIEGSCNAIVEAMACGLPIVSSTGSFNDDLLAEDMSIRVDPLDVAALRTAIVRLRDDPGLRARMGAAALRRSRQFDVDDRARRMLSFMAGRAAAIPRRPSP